jgi:hypothetical protein
MKNVWPDQSANELKIVSQRSPCKKSAVYSVEHPHGARTQYRASIFRQSKCQTAQMACVVSHSAQLAHQG